MCSDTSTQSDRCSAWFYWDVGFGGLLPLGKNLLNLLNGLIGCLFGKDTVYNYFTQSLAPNTFL
jgi:hypothetical protein